MGKLSSRNKTRCGLTVLALATWCASALAQPTEWVTIAISRDNAAWDVQPSSLEFKKTREGVPVYVVVGRIRSGTNSRIDLYKWYVSVEDCNRGLGKVISLSISGDYRFDNDFVVGGGNIASSMAEAICESASFVREERAKKSL